MLTPEGLTIPVLTGLAEDFGMQKQGLVGLLDWAYYSAVWSVGKREKYEILRLRAVSRGAHYI